MDWCGWRSTDQFGFAQPEVTGIVGSSGRCKLGGYERPHEYQVAVSFPGAEFVKGDHGHCSNLTDASGRLIATNGAEMAEAVRGWLVEDWLDGDTRRGLTHVFIDKLNLQYCEGSVRAVNFGRGNPNAYAVLNENWAIYLREAFLEARVVVFLINQDWLDSIPCNQEFEGLIRRKSTYATDGLPRAVVFVDITDPDYKGRLLPQYFANMRQQAAKHFDVHSIVYNEGLSPEQKREARSSLADIVRRYGTAHEAPSAELQDMATRTVQWRNWLYFGCLEGTNGWKELIDVQDFDWNKAVEDSGAARWPRPVFQCAAQGVLSRRFRLRVTRLGDGRHGEIQLVGWELFDAATGENIVRPGNGYIRAAGGLNPAATAMIDVRKGAWCHQCGSRQYTWLEWLVPDDQPPVAVSHMRLSQHDSSNQPDWNDGQCPHDFALECMPADVWPQHGPEFVRQYEHPLTEDDVTNLKGDKPPRWVQLHAVGSDRDDGTASSTAGSPAAGTSGDGWTEYPLAAAQAGAGAGGAAGTQTLTPACTAFRLRVTEVRDPASAVDVKVPGLRLQVLPEAELRPICGGACSGSGGDLPAERCGPGAAFDGNPFTRWVDMSAGGIGNSATWEYEHTCAVTVEEYAITSQIGTFGVLDGLHGAPRDWVLHTFHHGDGPDGGSWVELDRRSEVIFSNPRETKRFAVQRPVPGSTYRIVFSAVRCGCASASLQVGDIQLLARGGPPSAPEALHAAHVFLHPSSSHADMSEARWATEDPTRLQLSLPIHTSALPRPAQTATPRQEAPGQQLTPGSCQASEAAAVVGLAGCTMRWGGSVLSNWYEWPVEYELQCNEIRDGEVVRYGSQPAIAYRTDRERVVYGPRSAWLEIGFEGEVVVAGYGLRNHFEAQPRGEPRSWRLEAWRGADGGDSCGGGASDGTGAGTAAAGEGEGDAEVEGRGASDGAAGSCWEVIHEVPHVDYDTRLSSGTFYLRPPSRPARRLRLVFTEWVAPNPLAHLHSLHLLGWRCGAGAATAAARSAASDDTPGTLALGEDGSKAGAGRKEGENGGAADGAGSEVAPADVTLGFEELASVDLVLKKRQGAVRLERYAMLKGPGQAADPGTPVAWVLEGLTTEY